MNISSTMPVIRDGIETEVTIKGVYHRGCPAVYHGENMHPGEDAYIEDIESEPDVELTDAELEQAEQILFDKVADDYNDAPDYNEER